MESITGSFYGVNAAVGFVIWLLFLYLITNDAEKRGKTRWAWGLFYVANPIIAVIMFLIIKYSGREVVL